MDGKIKTMTTEKSKKSNSITIKMLSCLPWRHIEDIIINPDRITLDKTIRLRLNENMIATHCKVSQQNIKWTIEIADMIQWKDGYLRADFAHSECLEMTGRQMREIVDHPAFEGVIIKEVRMTSHAFRRSGVVFILSAKTSALSAEDWLMDPAMSAPAKINERYLSADRLKATPFLIKCLHQEGVDTDKLQQSYEQAAMHPYPDKREDRIHIPKDAVPISMLNMSTRVMLGTMTVKNRVIGTVSGKDIRLDTAIDHSKITLPYQDEMPATILLSLNGRDLADVIDWEHLARGSIISDARMEQEELILRIDEEPIHIPVSTNRVDHRHMPYHGWIVFADGLRFRDLDELIMITHPWETAKIADNWSQNLEVNAITTGSRQGRIPALQMRQKGLIKRFSERRDFAVVDDGWWICPLDRLKYEEWSSILRGTLTVKVGETIRSDGRDLPHNSN